MIDDEQKKNDANQKVVGDEQEKLRIKLKIDDEQEKLESEANEQGVSVANNVNGKSKFKAFFTKQRIIAISIAAVVFVALMLIHFFVILPKIYEGKKKIHLEIHMTEKTTKFNEWTESTTLEGFLAELKKENKLKYEVENSAYGPFLVSINDVKADSTKEFFAIYLKGKNDTDYVMANYGISTLALEEGVQYKIELTPYSM